MQVVWYSNTMLSWTHKRHQFAVILRLPVGCGGEGVRCWNAATSVILPVGEVAPNLIVEVALRTSPPYGMTWHNGLVALWPDECCLSGCCRVVNQSKLW